MTNKKDKISEALGTKTGLPTKKEIDYSTEIQPLPEKGLTVIADELKDKMAKNRAEDYDTARDNAKKLIEEGMSVVPEMFDMVKESENPKFYDSAASFLKVLMDLNKGLVSLSNDYTKTEVKKPSDDTNNKDKKDPEPQVQQTNVYITTESMLENVSRKKGKVIDVEYDEINHQKNKDNDTP